MPASRDTPGMRKPQDRERRTVGSLHGNTIPSHPGGRRWGRQSSLEREKVLQGWGDPSLALLILQSGSQGKKYETLQGSRTLIRELVSPKQIALPL